MEKKEFPSMEQMKKQKFTIGAFGIIVDKLDRVLLCHRCDIDMWNLPGGGVENGETPWQAVVREIKEETGFDSAIKRLQGVYTKSDKNEIVFSFECEITGGQKIINDEADQIEYFEIAYLPKNLLEKQRQRIQDWVGKKGEVFLTDQRS